MSFTLIVPSRCTDDLPDDLTKSYLVAESKLDGSRFVLYMGGCPYGRRTGNTLLSRHVSVTDMKHVDKTLNVPHITAVDYSDLAGTVLDGEIMANDFLATNSIMNSAPPLAISKQKEIGLLTYHVFDVMFFRGKDVRGLPLEQRRKIVVAICNRLENPNIIPIKQVTGDIQAFFDATVKAGGEGVIVKDSRQGYGRGWSKMKKTYDVSCIISGWKAGKGKYAKSVGAIAISVLHRGRLVEVGFASGFSDEIRNDLTKNFEKYHGTVVDIFAQEIQNSIRSSDNPVGRLRHPTFHRFRTDVNVDDCTSEKLLDDMSADKTRHSRSK